MSEIKLKLQPFQVPNYVGADDLPERVNGAWWPLHTVDAEVLAAMCDEWRRSVFAKAGKEDPQEEK